MQIGQRIGSSEQELDSVSDGANLGLGCGNPLALASLKTGETVLDLGSGAGFDCFLAAGRVGREGKVIGVDMTPEMIEKATENARRNGVANVEFRLGDIYLTRTRSILKCSRAFRACGRLAGMMIISPSLTVCHLSAMRPQTVNQPA